MRLRRTILVLDGDSGPALAIVRSLGRAGHRVLVGGPAPGSLAARSRGCEAELTLPDPARHAPTFGEAVIRAVAARHVDLVVPATDWSLVPLLEARERLEAHAPLAAPEREALEATLHKGRTFELARELGLRQPPTVLLSSLGDLDSVPADWSWPLVLKPCRSKAWSPEGHGEHRSVVYAADRETLETHAPRLLVEGDLLVQPWLSGEGVGLSVLAEEGRILHAFQHRRLHEVPLSGGGSSWRISVPIDPALRAMAQALLGALGWTGVAMLEAKQDAEGPWLVEVNGRFWGSLPLAIAAGVDFPAALVDLLVEGRRPSAPASYRVGVRARSLPGEVEWLGAALRRRALPVPGEHWDGFDWRDPAPGLVRIGQVAERVGAALERRRIRRRLLGARPRLEGVLRGARSLTFVCHGNIIRSVLGGALAGAALGDRLIVRSAGLGATPGRSPHARTLERASGHGLDVTDHGATLLDPELVASSDVLLVMEVRHALEVRERFPEASGRTFLLGLLDPEGAAEIADPVDGGPGDFEQAFGQVERSTARLVERLNGERARG